MTDQPRPRRAPQGPRLDPKDKPSPEQLRQQRQPATRRGQWNRTRR